MFSQTQKSLFLPVHIILTPVCKCEGWLWGKCAAHVRIQTLHTGYYVTIRVLKKKILGSFFLFMGFTSLSQALLHIKTDRGVGVRARTPYYRTVYPYVNKSRVGRASAEIMNAWCNMVSSSMADYSALLGILSA